MVIGAGLGGHCLAQVLRRHNVDVTVHERDDALLVHDQDHRPYIYIAPTGDRVPRDSLLAELYDLFRATAGYPPLPIVKPDDQLNETRVLEDAPDKTPLATDRLTLRQINVFTPLVGSRERYLGIGPHQPDEPVAQASARVERLPHDDLRFLTSPELHALALDMTKDWHPGLRAVIEHWLPDAVFPLTLRTSVPIPTWPTTPVTLLGDAIHTMNPLPVA